MSHDGAKHNGAVVLTNYCTNWLGDPGSSALAGGTITWSFNDGNGNISTSTQHVIIHDDMAPATPVLEDVTGQCSATSSVATTTDNCAGTVTGTTNDALTSAASFSFIPIESKNITKSIGHCILFKRPFHQT